MVYIYESHLAGLYVSEDNIDIDDLYCETCGDSDNLLLATDDIDEVRDLLKKRVSVFNCGGYSSEDCEEIYNLSYGILKNQGYIDE